MVIIDFHSIENWSDNVGLYERAREVEFTIKDGIIYDAKKLLKDVEQMVDKQCLERDKK